MSFVAGSTDDTNTSFVTQGTTTEEQHTEPTSEVVLEIGGRKFDKDGLTKKITHADATISALKQQKEAADAALAAAKAELATRLTAEEILKKVQQGQQQAPAESPATTSVDDVVKQVKGALHAESQAAIQAANFKEAAAQLTAVHGANADRRVREVAAETGMSYEAAVALAKTAPVAFKRLFPELSATTKITTVTQGTQGTGPRLNPEVSPAKLFMAAKTKAEKSSAWTKMMQLP